MSQNKNGDSAFISQTEFEEHYFPKMCEKYPIIMRVSKEEAEILRRRRGEPNFKPPSEAKENG